MTSGRVIKECIGDRQLSELTRGQKMAVLLADGAQGHSVTAIDFLKDTWGEIDPHELANVIGRHIDAVNGGDMSQLEAMLVGQAIILDAAFQSFSRRSAMKLASSTDLMDRYMRLGLKAQSQCRTTVETLAEIKNPRTATFVKQANIAQNQQVNNDGQPVARAGKVKKQRNELKGISHEPALDTRGPTATSRGDPVREAVGEVHRPAKRRRESEVES